MQIIHFLKLFRTIVPAIFLSCFQLEAQSGLGVSAGLNFSAVRMSDPGFFTKTGTKTGFVFGAYYRSEISGQWAFLTELQYASKGFSFFDDFSGSWVKIRILYLDFLPQMEFRPIPKIGVSAGMNIGRRLYEKIKGPDGEWREPIFRFAKDLDIGALAGIRFYLDRLNVGFHYNHGLTNSNDIIFTDINGNPLSSVKQKKQVLQMKVGYLLF